jgi:hypothetical protein
MSSLSPATSMALFQTSTPKASGGNPLDLVTQRLAEQVADGKMSIEQGMALSQAWQQIQDVVSLSAATGAAAFGPTDVNQMFAALRPALDIKV